MTVPSGWTSSRRQVPRTRHDAAAHHGVVDRVQAGGAHDTRVALHTRLVLVDAADQVVHMAQQLVGRQIEGGEVVHRGP